MTRSLFLASGILVAGLITPGEAPGSTLALVLPDHVALPDHAALILPDHAALALPDHAALALPDHAALALPDHAALALRGHAALAVPDKSASSRPDSGVRSSRQFAGTDTIRVSLSGAIERALEMSPDVLAANAKARYASARLSQARSSRLLTDLSATSAHALAPGLTNPNGTPNGQLYLDPDVRNDWESLRPFNRLEVDLIQPIWTWGELGRTIDAARFGLQIEEEGADSKRLEVAERTGEMYLTVVLLEALNRLTAEAGEAVARAKGEVERMLEEGSPDVDDADLFQVLITEQEILRRIAEVREQRATARTALRRQLMLPEDAVLETEDRILEPLPVSLDALPEYLERGTAYRPEIGQARAGVAARSALLDVARSAYFPKLVAGVSAHYSGAAGRYRQRNPYVGDAFLSRTVQTGLGVRLQLNFRQTRAKVEQARAELQEVRQLEVGARELVLFEVERAYREVAYRQDALGASEEALRLSREWLQTEYVNFDLDLGDTENLIKAVQTNLELQASRHQSVFDLNRAILKLHRTTGLLDPLMAY